MFDGVDEGGLVTGLTSLLVEMEDPWLSSLYPGGYTGAADTDLIGDSKLHSG